MGVEVTQTAIFLFHSVASNYMQLHYNPIYKAFFCNLLCFTVTYRSIQT